MPTTKSRRIPETACAGFPPVVARRPRALILGSMPGAKSLSEDQYYAHPQNAFWRIMAALFGMPVDTYAQRKALIRAKRLALWDVLEFCERAGSLDGSIRKDSIVVNDFKAFLAEYPSIDRIFFNGGMAATAFKRRVLPALPPAIRARLTLTLLPSTSPAMATKTYRQKLHEWRAVKDAVA